MRKAWQAVRDVAAFWGIIILEAWASVGWIVAIIGVFLLLGQLGVMKMKVPSSTSVLVWAIVMIVVGIAGTAAYNYFRIDPKQTRAPEKPQPPGSSPDSDPRLY